MSFRITALTGIRHSHHVDFRQEKKDAVKLAKQFCEEFKTQVWVEDEYKRDKFFNLKLVADYIWLDGKARRQ